MKGQFCPYLKCRPCIEGEYDCHDCGIWIDIREGKLEINPSIVRATETGIKWVEEISRPI